MRVYDISPYEGGLVITTEGNVGHVAFIEAIHGTKMTVREANYVHCQITSRVIDMSYEAIRGYR